MRRILALCLLLAACTRSAPPPTPPAPPVAIDRSPPAPTAPRAAPILPGLVLVANKATAQLDIVDGRTGRSLATLPTGVGPHEVAVAPDGRLAVVCNYGEAVPGDSLTIVDLPARAVARTIALGEHRRPHGVAFVPGQPNIVAVTSETSEALLLVDIVRGAVLTAIPTRQKGSHMVALRADGTRAYTANIGDGSITELDLVAHTTLRVMPVAAKAEAIALSPDGAALWVGSNDEHTVTVLDTTTLRTRAVLDAPTLPIRIALTRDGRHAVVSDALSGELRIFDAPAGKLRAAVPLPLDTPDPPPGPGDSPIPIGVVLVDDPAVALVSEARSGRVAVIDLASAAVVGYLALAPGIDGIAWAPTVQP